MTIGDRNLLSSSGGTRGIKSEDRSTCLASTVDNRINCNITISPFFFDGDGAFVRVEVDDMPSLLWFTVG